MKISRLETLQADAGFRRACFLKLVTDDGIVGWSEYGEHVGTAGITGVIQALGQSIVGMDPLAIERASAVLRGRTIQTSGGINHHAIAAIINALLDVKGKALGVPVHSLLGGAIRDSIPVYWSHFATYRVRHADVFGKPPLKTFDDIARLGEEARKLGFKAIKTGLMEEVPGGFGNVAAGFAHTPGYPELNVDRRVLRTLKRQLTALREGAGPDVHIALDVNFNYKTEGFLEVLRATEDFDLLWLELDTYDSAALARLRSSARCPIASCEAMYGRRGLRPFLEAGAVDVAIIDLTWNGAVEAMKMAAFAETYEVNVATHNYTGGLLGDVISAHFSAAVPNFRIGEWDQEDVPWKAEFLTQPLVVKNGELHVPQGAGWGVDVNEEFVRSRPPR
jgi:L-alanine-DL-glutamate epimerase-like enolase superfamily enzyme